MEPAYRDEETSRVTTRRIVLRSLAGLLAGGVVGALLGALVVVLLVGPAEYARSLGDNRPAGIVSASGTESGFTLMVTLGFAFWGALIGMPLGFVAGLFTVGRKPKGKGRKSL